MRALIRTHPFQAASAVVMMVLVGTTAYLVMTLIDTRSDVDDTKADVRIIQTSPCTLDPASRTCQRVRADGARAQSTHTACITTRKAGLGCPALEGRNRNASTDPDNGPGPGPSDPSGGARGDDPGAPGGGVADDPPASDPPAAGGDDGADPEPPDDGGVPPGGPASPPAADPSPPSLGDTIDSITEPVCGLTGELGINLPAACP